MSVQDECSAATDRIFVGSNGMTTSPDRLHYFVADPTEKKIGVFKRQVIFWIKYIRQYHLIILLPPISGSNIFNSNYLWNYFAMESSREQMKNRQSCTEIYKFVGKWIVRI